MDLSSFIDSVAEIFAEAVDVAGLFDGYHLALLNKRWKVAAPNDVVDSYFSTEQYLLARLEIDDADQVGSIETEEISEVTILAIAVGVIWIVEGSLVISREESNTFKP